MPTDCVSYRKKKRDSAQAVLADVLLSLTDLQQCVIWGELDTKIAVPAERLSAAVSDHYTASHDLCYLGTM